MGAGTDLCLVQALFPKDSAGAAGFIAGIDIDVTVGTAQLLPIVQFAGENVDHLGLGQRPYCVLRIDHRSDSVDGPFV